MKTRDWLFKILICTLIYSCTAGIDGNKMAQKKASLICLKENDTTMWVKITNSTDSTIYVPKEYDGDYTDNDDTLHFEIVNKPKYSVSYYYKYKSVFPFEFYTTRKIKGYKPDTIVKFINPPVLVNQFRLRPILPIKPGSSYIEKIPIEVPKYKAVVRAVYYNKPFLNKDRLRKFDYSVQDVLKFDSINAIHIDAPILIWYHEGGVLGE